MFRRRAALPQARPLNPCGQDFGPQSQWVVELDGSVKAVLEMGRTRLIVTGLVFALAFLTVAGRLVDLALLDKAEGSLAAHPAALSETASLRAPILDRNGAVLATTLPGESLFANPQQIHDPQTAAAAIAAVLPDLSQAEIAARLSSDRSFVWLKRGITPRETAAVNRLGIPGLYFQREERRFYPEGDLLSHVVGFTDIDSRGLAGIEKAFDEVLADASRPLQLSLDRRVQYILAEELGAAMREFDGIGAAGLVVDAHSGEILALVSLPTFDPLRAGDAPEEARFNRASLGVYEMGSVFKTFTAAMALDAGTTTLNGGYDASKPLHVSRYTISDYHPKNRWLSVPEIFMYSSNIGTALMAVDLGTKQQRRYFDALGLTRATPLELPEVGQPMVPSPWREINTMTIAYGHGIAVTPLQTVRAMAAVVNGGLLPPLTLIKRQPGEVPPSEPVLDPATSNKMRWLLRLVVTRGTGGKADVPGYFVGGKTGTAEKLSPAGGYLRNKRIASFVGAFPMYDPRYVVFAMVDEPKGIERTYGYATGGWVAAPVVGRTIERMAPLLGLPPMRLQDQPDPDRLLVPANVKVSLFAPE